VADVVATSYDAFTPGHGVHRVDEAAMYGQRIRYEDLVGAVDIVASKPGYGIISECAANGTALLYTDRGRFCEYEVLVREMPRYLEAAFIGQEDLLAGRWSDAVADLLGRPPRAAAPAEGATTAADWLSDRLDRC
jgi:L-arabinokinase